MMLTIAVLLPLFFLWLGFTAYRIQKPSIGPTISHEHRPNKALLVIDLQPVFLNGNGYGADGVAALKKTVLQKIKQEKYNGTKVIALQQEWSGAGPKVLMLLTAKGRGNAGTEGLNVLPEIAAEADHIIVKHIQDGFERSSLNALLETLAVGEVEIVGLDGLYCVRATALGAINRGFHTRVDQNQLLVSNSKKWVSIAAHLKESGIIIYRRHFDAD